MSTPTPVDQMNYEAAFAELEIIVATLEANQRPLDEAMALFERGQSLAAQCAGLLDRAELHVHQLTDLAGELSSSHEPNLDESDPGEEG